MECSHEYADRLKQVVKFLERQKNAVAVARHFGWKGFIPGEIVPTVIMSIYCLLRHPTNYLQAVGSATSLGGDTSTLGAVVGSLSGARLGVRKLPLDLIKQIPKGHYGLQWLDDLSHRLAYWPHGADDLHEAPALASSPTSIVQSNIAKWARHSLHLITRRPRILCVK